MPDRDMMTVNTCICSTVGNSSQYRCQLKCNYDITFISTQHTHYLIANQAFFGYVLLLAVG